MRMSIFESIFNKKITKIINSVKKWKIVFLPNVKSISFNNLIYSYFISEIWIGFQYDIAFVTRK